MSSNLLFASFVRGGYVMRASACIGRVGRIAGILGIGTAVSIGVAATACASPADSSPTRDSATDARTHGVQPSSASSRTRRSNFFGPLGSRETASITATADANKSANPSTLQPAKALGAKQLASGDVGSGSETTRVTTRLSQPIGAHSASPTPTIDTDTADREFPGTTENFQTLVKLAPTPPGLAKPAAAEEAMSSISTSQGDESPENASLLAMQLTELAGARRTSSRAGAAAMTAKTTAAATGGDPISRLFFNQTPTITTTQLSQGANGIVNGVIYADDLDGDSLNARYGSGANGSVVINYDGSYTYTPYMSSSPTGFVDSFELTITDAGSGTHIHGIGGLLNLLTFGLLGSSGHEVTKSVQVSVAPFKPNSSPTATSTIRSTDPLTGVVTGKISATDPDGDPLSYSPSVSTAKGTAVVASDGTFTYTPTASARHGAANTLSSTGKTDTFNIGVYDGFGGVATVPVTVNITPANSTPVAGSFLAGKPNVTTGVVVGTVLATDPDGDPLSYSGSATTSSGSVTVSTNGGFTYTPTKTARTDANATTTDTFTISASDAYGGVVAIPVTVRILPIPLLTQTIPDITTGVVTGTIAAPNFTGAPLNFTAATPSKGALTIDSATGSFTYTPTLTARHNAAATNATNSDKVDGFTVTISDSQGDAVYVVPISLTLRPQNIAPTGSFTVGVLDANTGVITGSVRGLDADADSLTFSGSGVTAEGRVVVDSATGTFTYTPVPRVDSVTGTISGFNSPAGVIIAPNGSRAYVTNSKGNSVSVVDTATRTIVATVAGITTPTALALTPSGNRLYVVGKTSVSIVDTSANTMIGNVSGLYAPAGSTPTPKAVAVSPDGTLAYVTNSTGVVSIVDTNTNSVVATISSTGSDSVVFSPDGKRAYVGYYVIDTATNKSTYLGSSSRHAFNPAGDRLYSLDSSGRLSGLDINGKSLSSDPSGAKTIVVGRDGSVVYGLGTKGEVVLFDAATLTLLGTAKYTCAGCGASSTAGTIYPNGLAVSPDGTFVYAVNPVNGTISVVTGWVGPTSDSFDVTINDGHGGTATVPVTVTFVG